MTVYKFWEYIYGLKEFLITRYIGNINRMNKQRVGYIDTIKGFAILLVVMGHVIQWSYSDFRSFPHNYDHILWKFIYSFHMPLFMFCSGLFLPRYSQLSSIKALLGVLVKKFKTLIIPYFCSGTLLMFATGFSELYWFILYLFVFTLLNLIIEFVVLRFTYRQSLIYVCYIIISIFFHFLTKHYAYLDQKPFPDIEHLQMYQYFCLGTVFMRFDILNKYLHNNLIFTISLCGFIVYFNSSFFYDIYFPLHDLVRASFAIWTIFYLFKEHFKVDSVVSRIFKSLGHYSLELYIVHFFFLVKLPFVGELWFARAEDLGGGNFSYCR